MPDQKYQRLTRERSPFQISAAFVSRSSLWLGADHLLFVQSSGWTETYKRFYFRDLQAISILKTRRGRIWNIVLGILTGLMILVILSTLPSGTWTDSDVAGGVTLGIITAVFLIFLLLNIFRGKTCKVVFRTAVQAEEIPSLSRVRLTHKVLGKIRPLIAAAQGALTAEEVSARMQETLRAENPVQPESPPPPAAVPPVIS